MTVSAVCDKTFCFVKCFVYIFCSVHCKYGREFFVCEFFAEIHAFHFTDKDFRGSRHVEACEFCNRDGLLSDDFCVERAVDENGLSHSFGLLVVEEVASSVLKLFLCLLVHFVEHDDGLFACANHTVIESF